MRETHQDFLERWARIVRERPREEWKPIQNAFLNAQYEKAVRFYQRYAEQHGEEAARRLKTGV